MGQYLLKGYCMLDQYCEDCQSPIMRDKQNRLQCVSCTIRAELLTKQEGEPRDVVQGQLPVQVLAGRNGSGDQSNEHVMAEPEHSFDSTRAILREKITWAALQLERNNSVTDCIELCTLMKHCVETIQTLDNLR
jgi:uncharacterized Zn finger protein (UPF0148 family)